MVTKRKLTDPVQGDTTPAVDEELKSLDPKAQPDGGVLQPAQIGAIHKSRTAAPHPFDGYKLKPKVMVGTDGKLEISSTHIVLLKHGEEPPPDPSNADLHIYMSDKPGGSGDPQKGDGKFVTVTIGTHHSRLVTNRQGTANTQVIFDRDILVGDTYYKCAICQSHAARAQVCFRYNERQAKVEPDPRYLLADTDQAVPLFRLFESIHYQRTRSERRAKDFDAAQES